jgi:S1-C subfamily serine protease
MRRFLAQVAVGILGAILVFFTGTVQAESWRVVGIPSNDTLNVRRAPSVGADRLAELGPNTTGITLIECANGVDVQALSRLNDSAIREALSRTWCLIQFGTLKGWVSANYLLLDRQFDKPNEPDQKIEAAWLVVFSSKSKEEAIRRARDLSSRFPFASVFKTKSGFFGVVLGAGVPSVLDEKRLDLITEGIITSDSYISTGGNFVELVWPVSGASSDMQVPPIDRMIRTGTGVVISQSGFVISNNHVTENCGQVFLRRADRVPVPATVLVSSDAPDLSVMQTSNTFDTAAVLRILPEPRLGEAVYIYGFPMFGALATSGNFTSGLLSAINGFQDDPQYLQMSAPVQSGNSGGPLMDGSGAVVGIVTAKMNGQIESGSDTVDVPQNVNFAIKSKAVREFLVRNNIPFSDKSMLKNLEAPEIAESAISFTVQVECYQ